MRIEDDGIPVRVQRGGSGLGIRLRQNNRDGETNEVWLTKAQSLRLAEKLFQMNGISVHEYEWGEDDVDE